MILNDTDIKRLQCADKVVKRLYPNVSAGAATDIRTAIFEEFKNWIPAKESETVNKKLTGQELDSLIKTIEASKVMLAPIGPFCYVVAKEAGDEVLELLKSLVTTVNVNKSIEYMMAIGAHEGAVVSIFGPDGKTRVMTYHVNGESVISVRRGARYD
jgi:hypothetical protein